MANESMVKSLGRALQILDFLQKRKVACGVTEISNELGFNKTSVYRMLSTFVQFGYVEQETETDRYKLGYKVLELSASLLESIDLRTEAKPFLKELEQLTNEVIHLVVYDRGEGVYIEKLEGNETLRMHSKVGTRAPMHCTSFGKAILAHLPRKEVEKVFETYPFVAHTPNTITDKELFYEHLNRIKEDGYALDLEENELGINCIAVPIFDHTGRAFAAFSISGPKIRMTEERLNELKDKVMSIGRQISKRLGYSE